MDNAAGLFSGYLSNDGACTYQLAECQQKHREMVEENTQLVVTGKESQRALEAMTQRAKALETEMGQTSVEYSGLQMAYAVLKRNHADTQTKLEQLQREYFSQSRRESTDLMSQRKSADHFKQKLQEEKIQTLYLRQELDAVTQDLQKQLEATIQDCSERTTRHEEAVETMRSNQQRLQNELQKTREQHDTTITETMVATRRHASDAQAQHQGLVEELAKLRSVYDTTLADRNDVYENMQQCVAANAGFQQAYASLQSECRALQVQLAAAVADATSTHERFTQQVDADEVFKAASAKREEDMASAHKGALQDASEQAVELRRIIARASKREKGLKEDVQELVQQLHDVRRANTEFTGTDEQVTRLNETVARLEERLRTLGAEAREVSASYSALTAAHGDLQTKHAFDERTLADVQQRLRDCERERKELAHTLATTSKSLRDCEEKLKNVDAKNAALWAENNTCKGSIQTFTSNLEDSRAHGEALRKTVADVRTQMTRLISEHDGLQAGHEVLASSHRTLESEHRALHATHTTSKTALASTQAKCDDLLQKNIELTGELEDAKEQSAKTILQLKQSVDSVKLALRDTEKRNEDLKRENATTTDRLQDVSEQHASLAATHTEEMTKQEKIKEDALAMHEEWSASQDRGEALRTELLEQARRYTALQHAHDSKENDNATYRSALIRLQMLQENTALQLSQLHTTHERLLQQALEQEGALHLLRQEHDELSDYAVETAKALEHEKTEHNDLLRAHHVMRSNLTASKAAFTTIATTGLFAVQQASDAHRMREAQAEDAYRAQEAQLQQNIDALRGTVTSTKQTVAVTQEKLKAARRSLEEAQTRESRASDDHRAREVDLISTVDALVEAVAKSERVLLATQEEMRAAFQALEDAHALREKELQQNIDALTQAVHTTTRTLAETRAAKVATEQSLKAVHLERETVLQASVEALAVTIATNENALQETRAQMAAAQRSMEEARAQEGDAHRARESDLVRSVDALTGAVAKAEQTLAVTEVQMLAKKKSLQEAHQARETRLQENIAALKDTLAANERSFVDTKAQMRAAQESMNAAHATREADLQQSVSELTMAMASTEKTLHDTRAETVATRASLKDAQERVVALRADVTSARRSTKDAQARGSGLTTAVAHATRSLRDAEGREKKLREDVRVSSAMVTRLERNLEGTREDKRVTQQSLEVAHQKREAELASTVETLKGMVAASERAFLEAKAHMRAAQESLNDAHLTREMELQQSVSELSKVVASTEKTLQDTLAEKAVTQAALRDTQERVVELRQNVADARKRGAVLSTTVSSNQKSLQEAERREKMLTEDARVAGAMVTRLERDLATTREDTRVTQQSLKVAHQKREAELTLAVETLKGVVAASEKRSRDTQAELLAAKQSLKDAAARASLAVEAHGARETQLLSEKRVSEEAHAAREVQRQQRHVEELKGTVVAAEKTLRDARSEMHAAQQSLTSAHQAQEASMLKKIDALSKSAAATERELQNTRAELDAARAREVQTGEERVSQTEHISKLMTSVVQHADSLAAYQADASAAQQALKSAHAEREKQLQDTVAEWKAKVVVNEQTLRETGVQVRVAEEMLAEAQARESRTVVAHKAQESQLRAAHQTLDSETRAVHKATVTELEQNVETWRGKAATTEQALHVTREEKNAVEKALEGAAKELAATQKVTEEMQRKLEAEIEEGVKAREQLEMKERHVTMLDQRMVDFTAIQVSATAVQEEVLKQLAKTMQKTVYELVDSTLFLKDKLKDVMAAEPKLPDLPVEATLGRMTVAKGVKLSREVVWPFTKEGDLFTKVTASTIDDHGKSSEIGVITLTSQLIAFLEKYNNPISQATVKTLASFLEYEALRIKMRLEFEKSGIRLLDNAVKEKVAKTVNGELQLLEKCGRATFEEAIAGTADAKNSYKQMVYVKNLVAREKSKLNPARQLLVLTMHQFRTEQWERRHQKDSCFSDQVKQTLVSYLNKKDLTTLLTDASATWETFTDRVTRRYDPQFLALKSKEDKLAYPFTKEDHVRFTKNFVAQNATPLATLVSVTGDPTLEYACYIAFVHLILVHPLMATKDMEPDLFAKMADDVFTEYQEYLHFNYSTDPQATIERFRHFLDYKLS
jgi:chromosome segregation ATPase